MNPEDHANGSIQPGEPILMTQQDQAAVFKFPCDGLPRYTVREERMNTFGPLTYSEAYDAIWVETGCKEDAGKKVLTLEGVRRIKALNQKYISIAGTFIRAFFEEEKRKKAAQDKKEASITIETRPDTAENRAADLAAEKETSEDLNSDPEEPNHEG